VIEQDRVEGLLFLKEWADEAPDETSDTCTPTMAEVEIMV
jgi:hypothetical protein